ncbi:BAHD acyltransferase DCR-like [Salvia splendens]|uniref:BAHD acyltransferase DCR-like n=1 Tax=Salvia splendens TaxID=180675 RepID=UPI001C259C39|nr:BAHD acyltransferase DCR-like [Salvia splendens]
MEGVEFVEAEAGDVEVAELTAEEGFSRFKELLPYNGVLNLEGLERPLLAVQLTKLKDGLAIGLAFNHAILDGTSTWHFMSSWAAIGKGATSVPVPRFLDRTKARNTRMKLDLSQPSDAPEHANSALRGRVFKFPASAIDQIMSKVNNKMLESLRSKDFDQEYFQRDI